MFLFRSIKLSDVLLVHRFYDALYIVLSEMLLSSLFYLINVKVMIFNTSGDRDPRILLQPFLNRKLLFRLIWSMWIYFWPLKVGYKVSINNSGILITRLKHIADIFQNKSFFFVMNFSLFLLKMEDSCFTSALI